MEQAAQRPNILWVDVETSGLEDIDIILEVGLVYTTAEGEILDSTSSLVWQPGWRGKAARSEVVTEMHRKSGLLEELDILDNSVSRGDYTPSEVSKRLSRWVHHNVADHTLMPMAGSSVHFDRRMLRLWMPSLEACWHYRNLDVSSFREACRMWNSGLFAKLPEVRNEHRAIPDIEDSISLWKFFVDNFLWVED